MTAAMPNMPSPLLFTDAAAAKVKNLIEEEKNPGLMLRVFVSGGGCSGFQYGFTFEESANEDDTRVEKSGVTLLVDPLSFPVSRWCRDRLQGRPQRRAVRDQEPTSQDHLRLRFVV